MREVYQNNIDSIISNLFFYIFQPSQNKLKILSVNLSFIL